MYTKVEVDRRKKPLIITQELVNKHRSFRDLAEELNTNKKRAKDICDLHKLDYTHFAFYRKSDASVGKKFALLKILEIKKETKPGKNRKHARIMAYIECDCGKKGWRRFDGIVNGRVKSCGCLLYKNKDYILGDKNPAFTGHQEIRGMYWSNIKRGAKVRNLEFNITIEYAWSLFEKQNGRCAISGVPIRFGRVHFNHERTASLDRIDNTKGYIEGNVQWIYKDIQFMKTKFPEEYFIEICKNIGKYEEEKANECLEYYI